MQKVTKFEFEIMYDDSETTEEDALTYFRNILIDKGLFRENKREVTITYWPLENEQD